ncbi:GTP-binding protein, partial [Helicobacter pylori]
SNVAAGAAGSVGLIPIPY